jgi:copper oxidase (laccase) domain-containing protein
MLYDQTRRMLGLVHSGWRGSARNIIGAAAAKMKELGARTENMLAAVTPSLGPCCAEFRNYEKELPRRFQRFMVSENHFDFWAISVEQLVEAGLKAENIEVAGLCTKCSAEFFSYRRGDVWGRFGILAGVLNS